MWQCSNCGEQVEDNFGVCWNCQNEKGTSITLLEEQPQSWECDACGAEVASQDTICSSCGADISEVAGPQVFCPKCGARVDDDAEFCSSCATRIWASDVVSCPSCAKSICAQDRVCKYCATDLTRKILLPETSSSSSGSFSQSRLFWAISGASTTPENLVMQCPPD
jgi:predicted RNA-binding Zn-ribbon protein involved in translation (DUF1610 family)